MASVRIRGLSETTVTGIRRRAARHGRSLEAEVRAILEQLAAPEAGAADDDDQPFGSWLMAISRPGVDLTPMLDQMRGRSSKD